MLMKPTWDELPIWNETLSRRIGTLLSGDVCLNLGEVKYDLPFPTRRSDTYVKVLHNGLIGWVNEQFITEVVEHPCS